MDKTPKEQYLEYLDSHISAVNKAYHLLVSKGIIRPDYELEEQIEHHDESKYLKEEWDAYLNKFYIPEKANEMEFKYAWLNHLHNNPHHPQYWCLQEDDNPGILEPLDMPENYIIEMICDWLAFSINKGDLSEIQKWYKETGSTYIMSNNTRKRVEEILKAIEKIS